MHKLCVNVIPALIWSMPQLRGVPTSTRSEGDPSSNHWKNSNCDQQLHRSPGSHNTTYMLLCLLYTSDAADES